MSTVYNSCKKNSIIQALIKSTTTSTTEEIPVFEFSPSTDPLADNDDESEGLFDY